jgi:hypothetical protein
MKKKMKKLVLAKETVRSLEDLRNALGGASQISYCDSCGWPNPCEDESTKG